MDQILLGRYIPWWLNFYTGGVPPLCCGGQGLPEPHSCSRPLQPGAAGPRTGRAPLLRLNWSGLMVSPTVLPTRNSLSQNASGIPTEKCQFRGTLFFFFYLFLCQCGLRAESHFLYRKFTRKGQATHITGSGPNNEK